MKTADEIASLFFQDTGERKSTNWTRLRDEIRSRDSEWAVAIAPAAGPCKRCGGPKRDFQVYCGAACSVLAEAGK